MTVAELAELAEAYRDGASAPALGKRYGCSPGTVTAALRRAGVELRPPGAQPGSAPVKPKPKPRPKPEPPRALCQCGCGELANPGRRYLAKHGARRSPLIGREEEVIEVYKKGTSLSATARQFRCTADAVKRVLETAGVRIRPDKGGRPSRRREILEEAQTLDVTPAEDVTCVYRPPVWGSGSLLQPPMCGRPVTLAGAREPLCDGHRNAGRFTTLTRDEEAIRLREQVIVRCACGWSCDSTAKRSSAVFEHHRRTGCPAVQRRRQAEAA